MSAGIFFGLLGAAALVMVLWRKAPRRYPYCARAPLTPNEAEFFARLVAAFPEGFVFPQVSMGALIEPKGGTPKDRLAAFRAISQKRVDYVVCDSELAVVCVVELDDRTHDATADQRRDAVLQSAGIQTMRWQSRCKPASHEVRAALLPLTQLNRSRS